MQNSKQYKMKKSQNANKPKTKKTLKAKTNCSVSWSFKKISPRYEKSDLTFWGRPNRRNCLYLRKTGQINWAFYKWQ